MSKTGSRIRILYLLTGPIGAAELSCALLRPAVESLPAVDGRSKSFELEVDVHSSTGNLEEYDHVEQHGRHQEQHAQQAADRGRQPVSDARVHRCLVILNGSSTSSRRPAGASTMACCRRPPSSNSVTASLQLLFRHQRLPSSTPSPSCPGPRRARVSMEMTSSSFFFFFFLA